jgi:hypothetical protein
VSSKIFGFLAEKSHFLGGSDEKNTKISSFYPKKWGKVEKKQFFEWVN